MSDSDHDEDDLPSAEECQKASEEFATITGTDTALAMFYLQGINLRVSVNNWCELANCDWVIGMYDMTDPLTGQPMMFTNLILNG